MSSRIDDVSSISRSGEHSMTRDQVTKRISNHLASLIELPYAVRTFRTPARPLLFTPERFDLLAKYIYAQYRENGLDTDWHRLLYQGHIDAFTRGTFVEGDESQKTGIQSFLDHFAMTIESMRASGFQPDLSLIPINSKGVIIDGAHRVAAAALFNLDIAAVEVDTTCNYDFQFFRDRGLADQFADHIVSEFCRLNPLARIAMFFPCAEGSEEEEKSRQLMSERARIFYRKSLRLVGDGPTLLTAQVYSSHPWVGSIEEGYPGARRKAKAAFRGRAPVRVWVLEPDTPDETELIELKERIRSIYGQGNHSIHITDTHAETLIAAGALLNQNSVHYLNHARITARKQFDDLFSRLKEWLSDSGLREDNVAIDGSAVMAAYGLRDCRDLDFLSTDPTLQHPDERIDNHFAYLDLHSTSVDALLYDPRNHFYRDGIKFVSLDRVRMFKKARSEAKDRHDLRLIEATERRRSLSLIALQIRGWLTSNKSVQRTRRFVVGMKQAPRETLIKTCVKLWRAFQWLLPRRARESILRVLKQVLVGVPLPKKRKHEIILQFQGSSGIHIFVETGTYQGETIEAMRPHFRELYSIELSKDLHARASEYFAEWPNITLLRGNSAEILPGLVEGISERCLFWLDAHGSGTAGSRGVIYTPVLQELQTILRRSQDDVILIDDARLFNGTRDYPTLKQVKRLVKQLQPGREMYVLEDIICIHSPPRQADARH